MGLLKGSGLGRTIILLAVEMLGMLWGHSGRPVIIFVVVCCE